MLSRFKLSLAVSLAALTAPAVAQRVTPVASFEHEATGVAAAADGRLFVNFPRWNADVPISVAQVGPNGALTAYPDAEWNSWRNANSTSVEPRSPRGRLAVRTFIGSA